MGYDRNTREYGTTSGNISNKSDEQRAREKAYQEYLSLRESNSSRGGYVKNDDLYGSYFSGSRRPFYDHENSYRGPSIDDTPYGASEMRRKNKEKIARQGRVNKADLDKPLKERDLRAEYEAARMEARREEYSHSERYSERREEQRAERRSEKRSERRADKRSEKRSEKPRKKSDKRKKKKSGRGLRIALIVVLILVLGIGGVMAAGITIVKNTLDNVGRVELDPTLIGINPVVDEQLSGYRNIAILGIDARDMSNDAGVRSDAIIIASINEETGEIKLFSVYRDTMLDLGDDVGLDKITHAYFYGGPTKVLYTLNKNLDLNIKEVVVVNWKSVADVVDALGGIDVKIEDSEINELNRIINHTAGVIGGSSEDVTSSGKQTLNGNQAVAYARIRKDAATGDYRRNERMKIVVKATFNKALEMDVKALKKISNDILPNVKTNMSSRDMMGMIMDLTSYQMTDSIGWPYTTRGWTGNAWYGPPVTLNSNVIQLHKDLFGQEDYQPTDDVSNISSRISATTGYY